MVVYNFYISDLVGTVVDVIVDTNYPSSINIKVVVNLEGNGANGNHLLINVGMDKVLIGVPILATI